MIYRRKQQQPMVPLVLRETGTRIHNRLTRFSLHPSKRNDYSDNPEVPQGHNNIAYNAVSVEQALKSGMPDKGVLIFTFVLLC
jgi:hypothetical protein